AQPVAVAEGRHRSAAMVVHQLLDERGPIAPDQQVGGVAEGPDAGQGRVAARQASTTVATSPSGTPPSPPTPGTRADRSASPWRMASPVIRDGAAAKDPSETVTSGRRGPARRGPPSRCRR